MKLAKPFKSIPGPLTLPIIGNLWQYKLGLSDPLNYHKNIEQLHKQYGPIVKQKLGDKKIVHVFSPEDTKTIYQHEGKIPHIFPLQDTIYWFRKNENLTLGLGNSNGEEWYKLRNSLRHLLLTPKGIQNFTKNTDEVTHDLINQMKLKRKENGSILHFKTELMKWSLEAAGLMCFGKKIGYMSELKREKAESLLKANQTVFYLSTILKFDLPFYEKFYSPTWEELRRSEIEILDEAINNTKEALCEIKEIIKNKEEFNGRFTVLTSLIKREEITEDDIYILTQSLFTDGLSTTVPSLIYNLYCLAKHPEKQELAYKEVSKYIKPGDTITNDILNELTYVKCVVKETFRLYPIGTEISRVIKEDMVLSGYEIPKETHININMNVNFMKDDYFEDPKSFSPERWLRNNNNKKMDPFILTPFGHGARTCLGRRFAEQNLHTALAHILSNFKVYIEPKTFEMNQVFNILLFPSGNFNFKFQPR